MLIDVPLLGRYIPLDIIAAGGQGQIARGTDTVTGETVAIKSLASAPESSTFERDRSRFTWEGSLRFNHPHIVDPIVCDCEGAKWHTVFPFVDGLDLGALLERRTRPFTPEETLGLLDPVASALDAVHAQGIVHRDIKPENIMVSKAGEVFLVDFGIATRPGEARLTSAETMLGSPLTMAPEQFGTPSLVDHRADLYALAAVAYTLLTGKPVRTGTTANELNEHVWGLPVRPSAVQPSLPESVDRFFSSALALDPEDRPRDTVAFIKDLRGALTSPLRCLACGARATDTDDCGSCGRAFSGQLLAFGDGQKFLVAVGSYTTGRHQLCPEDRRVSRTQIRVECGRDLRVSDLGAPNPTLVDGVVANASRVSPSSRVRLGVIEAHLQPA